MGEFFVGLVLAGISALTFLAYNHPQKFRRLRGPMIFTAALLFGAASLWLIAVGQTELAISRELSGALDHGELKRLRSAASLLKPDLWALFGLPTGFIALVIGLDFVVADLKDQKAN